MKERTLLQQLAEEVVRLQLDHPKEQRLLDLLSGGTFQEARELLENQMKDGGEVSPDGLGLIAQIKRDNPDVPEEEIRRELELWGAL